MEINTSDVVAFKLLTGSEIIGKLSKDKTHSSFVEGADVIYLDDALFIGITEIEGRGASVVMVPITGLGVGGSAGQMPFALQRGTIIGQFPLEPQVEKMYKERTTGIVLAR